MNENAFIAALQDINNHPVRFGECTITFTFHDGRLQYYTLTTSERKNIAEINTGFKKMEFQNATGMNRSIPGRQEMLMMKNAFRPSSSIRIGKVMIRSFSFLVRKELEKLTLELQLFGKLAALLFQLKK